MAREGKMRKRVEILLLLQVCNQQQRSVGSLTSEEEMGNL
jgi:hypothetical protein